LSQSYKVSKTFENIVVGGLSAASVASTASNGVAGSFANNATSFETIRVTNSGSGLIASFRNSGGEVASIGNSGGILASGSISSTPQGTLYGTASGSITSAQLATSLTDETGTGSAVFSASPTFTGTVTGADAHFSGSLGIGISPTFPLHVSKSLSNNYIAQLTNTNTTAGTSF
jgi:hypothetical protein